MPHESAPPENGKGQALYQRAKQLIPGGTQLLSKRPEMFLPDRWPAYYAGAEGVRVTDLDGNTYTDMSISGVGSCILGYADPDVNAAVLNAVSMGSMSTLNCPEEVELAEVLLDLHPWAERARFGRCGGEAMAMAVRIARAASGRDRIAFCGYHGWHDWYLAANLGGEKSLDGHLLPGLDPAGVPRALRGTALPFAYNRFDELQAIVAEHGSEIGVIVMEPVRGVPPKDGFLEKVRALADRMGAVLVFDEVSAGFRQVTGGAHLKYGVTPDIAVFAKAMSNGFPMAAVIGTASVMEAAQGSFISSTYWTERIGPVAALATIRKHRDHDVATHLCRIGDKVREGWEACAASAGLKAETFGVGPVVRFVIECDDFPTVRTLFTRHMLEAGYLAGNALYATYAHTNDIVERYLEVVESAFRKLKISIDSGTVANDLDGEPAHTGFHRLTT